MINIPLPRKRQRDISVQQIGSETLVYDEIRHQAFCLNHTSAAIWRMCDGAHTVTALSAAATKELQAPVSEKLVQFALAALLRDGLLQPEFVMNASRRKLMRTLGAGAVAMLPLVSVVVAPTAAQAYTGCADCVAPSVKQNQQAVAAQKARAEQADPWNTKIE